MSKQTQTIQAGKFKTHCLQLMDEVNEKQITFTITKHGKPIAKLIPIEPEKPVDPFGCMKDTITVVGDIVEPIDVKWDANE